MRSALICLVTALLCGAPVIAAEPAHWDWAAMPAVGFTTDEGWELGLVGQLYRYADDVKPYALAIGAQANITSKLIQNHSLSLDWPRAFGKPLRLLARASYFSTLTRTYCGLEGRERCGEAVATTAASDLEGTAREDFLRRFYLLPYVEASASAQLRWEVIEGPRRVSIFGGARVSGYHPGSWSEPGPHPESLYSRDFPNGEPGLATVVQVGVLVDTRDDEPAPNRGIFCETSLRGTSSILGSTWSFGAWNATLRGYWTPLEEVPVVLATRLVFDALVGEAPVPELARVGGTQDAIAFGGQDLGRGLRQQRAIGRQKAIGQLEARWTIRRFTVGEHPFAVGVVAFFDAGLVGLGEGAGGFEPPLAGTGGGLRIHSGSTFVLRIDVGTSAAEGWAPGTYVAINHVF